MNAQSTKLQSFTNGLTLSEIGQRMGLTRARVRQIEVRALIKLQKQLDLRNLKHINQII
ncbi:MAG: hypothetical protein K9J14_04840 [Polynucleobacter sp.]|nr:hypothetical protein [Polynucleobacter sp.]